MLTAAVQNSDNAGGMIVHLHRLFAAIVTVAALACTARAAAPTPCPLTAIGRAKIASVRDGRTLALADGRVLRLAAIEVPADGHAALQALAAGQTLRLERLGADGADHDRYGRLVAFAFAGDASQSLEEALIEAGKARVSARVGDMACAEMLLTAEKAARAAHRGLWADPNFAPLPAENLAGLRRERGHFALVEGKVLSVHASGGTIYLNFGRHWTRDFSVLIPRRRERAFAAAGVVLRRLNGQRIRVRGWIEERRGPIVEAEAPEQIELLESPMQAAKP
jgi:endonuclease YncB( thermonuclease family)